MSGNLKLGWDWSKFCWYTKMVFYRGRRLKSTVTCYFSRLSDAKQDFYLLKHEMGIGLGVAFRRNK